MSLFDGRTAELATYVGNQSSTALLSARFDTTAVEHIRSCRFSPPRFVGGCTGSCSRLSRCSSCTA